MHLMSTEVEFYVTDNKQYFICSPLWNCGLQPIMNFVQGFANSTFN